jgi:hypothetical protein
VTRVGPQRLRQLYIILLRHLQVVFGPSDKRIKTTDINRHESFQKTAGYTLLGHKNNEEILDDLQEPAEAELKIQKSNWLNVTRMNNRNAKKK